MALAPPRLPRDLQLTPEQVERVGAEITPMDPQRFD
jgi:hypothetical protein